MCIKGKCLLETYRISSLNKGTGGQEKKNPGDPLRKKKKKTRECSEQFYQVTITFFFSLPLDYTLCVRTIRLRISACGLRRLLLREQACNW